MNQNHDSQAGILIKQTEHISVVFQTFVENNAVIHIFYQDKQRSERNDHNTALTVMAISPDRHWVIVDGSYALTLFPQLSNWHDWLGVGFVDAVKITFVGTQLHACEWQGKPCFAFRMPDQIHQIQRRSFYRVETDDSIEIDVQLIDINGHSWPTDVLNISLGGCALHLPTNTEEHFSIPGQYQALLRLNNQHSLVFKIELLKKHHDNEHLIPSGVDGVIIGCQYLLENDTQAKILQRFVVNAERQQRARANGLTV